LNSLARRTNSPWSKTYKEGLTTSAVNDHVNIDQTVVGAITTGVIDSATGQWKGITVTDDAFLIDATHEAVPNTGAVLSPQATPDYINMTGFNDLFIALNVTVAGNYRLRAKLGPATNYFANLTPIDAGITIRMMDDNQSAFADAVNDAVEVLTVDVWNIFSIQKRIKDQKVLQFEIQNNSGSEADIKFAYLRVA